MCDFVSIARFFDILLDFLCVMCDFDVFFDILMVSLYCFTMKEKDIQREFGRVNEIAGVFELKLSKGPSIRFDALADHQLKALIAANSDCGCYHKISDFSFEQKPFDCFKIKNYPAYVVVCFYVPRKKKMLYYVEIASWIDLSDRISPRKSAKECEIQDISSLTIDLYHQKNT